MPRLVPIDVSWRTDNASKQFPTMHVKFPKIICIKIAMPSCRTNRRCNHSIKNFRRDAIESILSERILCEHEMHGPHFVIGGQEHVALCLH